jgi:GNAT superfamily N-acetyltransferase
MRNRTEWTPRALDATRHGSAVIELWDRVLGSSWPVHPRTLLDAMPLGYGIESRGRLLGAIGFDATGAISFVIVDAARRREGIGRSLHDAALDYLSSAAPCWRLGGSHTIWRGVPDDLPSATRFFEALGWSLGSSVADLAMPLADFSLDPSLLTRAQSAGITFMRASASDASEVVAYARREHPEWTTYFQERFPEEPESVLVARDVADQIVAALLIDLPPRHTGRWSRILGAGVAEIGCVGVMASRNGEGIGSALVGLATAEVARAGAPAAFLAWTTRVTFYERLGYRLWHNYQTAERR